MALEQVFVSPVRIEDLRSSPLGGCIEDFCDWLLSSGFSRSTVRRHLSNVSHLGSIWAVNGWLPGNHHR